MLKIFTYSKYMYVMKIILYHIPHSYFTSFNKANVFHENPFDFITTNVLVWIREIMGTKNYYLSTFITNNVMDNRLPTRIHRNGLRIISFIVISLQN